MKSCTEILLAIFLLSNLFLTGTGRLRSAIRIVACQGWLVAILPMLFANGRPDARVIFLASINFVMKGLAMPALVLFAAKKAKTTFELEPLVGFHLSQIIAFLIMCASFIFAKTLHAHEQIACELAIPVAFATIGCGLFLICARRKAITQVVGFLAFENGISIFGAGLMLEYGIIAELGILLDVFALVFILGIAIHQINRTFSSTDTDKLNHLGDTHLLHHGRHA